jgi:crotonobetainyl-CoA:carnitine CoA-transferase CaiB-like acyl-CoA transferase
MFVDVPHATFGPIRQVGIPIKLSATPGAIRSNAPVPGQHTDEILGQLGYSPADIARLRDAGVVNGPS